MMLVALKPYEIVPYEMVRYCDARSLVTSAAMEAAVRDEAMNNPFERVAGLMEAFNA